MLRQNFLFTVYLYSSVQIEFISQNPWEMDVKRALFTEKGFSEG